MLAEDKAKIAKMVIEALTRNETVKFETMKSDKPDEYMEACKEYTDDTGQPASIDCLVAGEVSWIVTSNDALLETMSEIITEIFEQWDSTLEKY